MTDLVPAPDALAASVDPARADPARPWFPALDGLRALAALLVLVFHVTGAVAPFPRWTWGHGLIRLGNVGVALFFVLSGFLLSRPFFVAHLRRQPQVRLGRYVVRRLVRIVPAYWVALSVWLFAVSERTPVGGGEAYPWFYGFGQIYYDRRTVDGGGSLGVAWTLCIEVTFYLVLPALAFALLALAGRGPARRQVRVLVGGCSALFVGGLLLHWWLALHEPIARYWLPGHLGWFAGGMGLAAVSAGAAAGVDPPVIVTDLARFPAVPLAAAVGVFGVSTLLPLPTAFGQTAAELFTIHACNAVVSTLLVLPFVVGPQGRGRVRGVMSSPPARWLGELSYGLYLWHTIVLYVVNRWVEDDLLPGAAPVRLVVVGVISLALAQISWLAVERPALRLAATVVGGRRPRR